jgi:hypothetical protein
MLHIKQPEKLAEHNSRDLDAIACGYAAPVWLYAPSALATAHRCLAQPLLEAPAGRN